MSNPQTAEAIVTPDTPEPGTEPGTGPKVDASTGVGAKKSYLKKAEKLIGSAKDKKASAETQKVNNLLRRSLKAYKRHDYMDSVALALEATNMDDQNPQAHHILAMGLENIGELHKALVMYERALQLDPTETEVYLNLGLIAWKMKMIDGAERLFRLYIDMNPDSHSGYNNLGGVLRDKGKLDDAIDLVRGALMRMPGEVELWNTMGTIAMENGEVSEAITFYEEAIRLNPKFARAHYNIAYTYDHLGQHQKAMDYYNSAIKLMNQGDPDFIEASHGRALCRIALGDVVGGWDEYQIRHNIMFRGGMHYAVKAPRYQGGDLSGKRVLVIAEQGIGDEILFANPLGDLIEAVGPEGQVLVCVNQRLLKAFARTYPTIKVGPYGQNTHNGKHVRVVAWQDQFGPIDYYMPMGDLCLHFRPDVASYRPTAGFLKADPELVADWKHRLAEISDGPLVGLCWKSGLTDGHRRKYYSEFERWAPILKHQDVTFINLQYADYETDIAYAKDTYGVDILNFEDFDIKLDLEKNLAMCKALDLVISAPTAAAAISGAVGTKTWITLAVNGWVQLGEDDYPWYPDAEAFSPDTFGDWDNVLGKVGVRFDAFLKDFKRES